MQKLFLVLVLILGAHQTAFAKQTACQKNTSYNQFDFWLGEWRVEDAKGQYQGTNKITKSSDGCLIKEFWTSATGNNGFSMNYYNPRTDKWTQNWVSTGSIIDYSGGLVDGSMVLEGKIYYQGQETSADFRGTWRLLDDGRVRQFFEQYNADKQSWNVWFEGFYSKVETTIQ